MRLAVQPQRKKTPGGGADIQPPIFAHVMGALSSGLLAAQDNPAGDSPALENTLETIADMLDRTLIPQGNGDSTAAKAIIRQMARDALARFGLPGQLDDETRKPA